MYAGKTESEGGVIAMLQLTLFRKTRALRIKERDGGRALLVITNKAGDEKFDFSGRNKNNIFVLLSPEELAALCLFIQNPKVAKFDIVHKTDTSTKSCRATPRRDGLELFISEKRGGEKRFASFTLSRPESYLLFRFATLLIDKSFTNNNFNHQQLSSEATPEAPPEEDVEINLGWG